jgi:hypothetical protein
MARFRSRPRYRYIKSSARRSYHSGGGWKGLIAPAAGGAGDVIAQKFIPINGVGSTVAGMFLHDSITMKIGLNKVGESLGYMFAGGGSSGSSGGWL